MSERTDFEAFVQRGMVRETLEKYLVALDDQDWDRIADCFTTDAVSHYNHEPEQIDGGVGVADWLRRMVAYDASNHSLSNVAITVDGDTAFAHSRVIVTLHQAPEGGSRVKVRGIDYKDHLVKVDGEWKIRERLHAPTMQYDALSAPRVLFTET